MVDDPHAAYRLDCTRCNQCRRRQPEGTTHPVCEPCRLEGPLAYWRGMVRVRERELADARGRVAGLEAELRAARQPELFSSAVEVPRG